MTGPIDEQLPSPERDPVHSRDRGSWRLDLRPETVWTFQIRAIALLVALSTAGQLLSRLLGDVPGVRFLAWLAFVDGEQTIPALYSSAVLFAGAGVAGVIGWRIDSVPLRTGWRLLAAVMALAGFDEYAAIHEKAIEPLRDTLAISDGLLYYAWIIPGAIAVAVLAVGFSGFLRRLPVETRTQFLIAGALFVAGAIGVEAIGGGYVSGSFEAADPGVDPTTARSRVVYVVLATVEETLEMIGAAVFLTAGLAHLERHLGRHLAVSVVAAD